MRKIILMVLSCALLGTAAHAQSSLLEGDVSFNAAVLSDYRFRGVTRSNNDFAAQGGIDFYSDSGLFAGAWISSVKEFSGADAETNLYMGYSGEKDGMTYEFGATAYLFPGGESVNHIETYGSIGVDFGLLTSSVGIAYMPSQANLGNQDNIYIYTDTEAYIPDTPFSINLHLGFEDGAFGSEKIDWRIGTKVSFEQFEFGVSYIDTNVDWVGKRAGGGVMFSVGAYF